VIYKKFDRFIAKSFPKILLVSDPKLKRCEGLLIIYFMMIKVRDFFIGLSGNPKLVRTANKIISIRFLVQFLRNVKLHYDSEKKKERMKERQLYETFFVLFLMCILLSTNF